MLANFLEINFIISWYIITLDYMIIPRGSGKGVDRSIRSE